MPFIIIFIVIPLIELGLFASVSEHIGIWTTLGLAFLTAVIGGSLVKAQGLHTLYSMQTSMKQGQLPLDEIFDGFCLVAAGALLITPGVFSDTIGFLLLIPHARKFTRHILINHTNWQHVQTNMHYSERTSDRAHDPNVIEAEYEEIKPDDKDR